VYAMVHVHVKGSYFVIFFIVELATTGDRRRG
jgi:hypothetical protein